MLLPKYFFGKLISGAGPLGLGGGTQMVERSGAHLGVVVALAVILVISFVVALNFYQQKVFTQAQVEVAERELARLEQWREGLAHQNEELRSENKRLKGELSRINSEIDQISSQLEEITQKNKLLEQRISNLRVEQERLEKMSREVVSKEVVSPELERLKEKNLQLRHEHQVLSEEKSKCLRYKCYDRWYYEKPWYYPYPPYWDGRIPPGLAVEIAIEEVLDSECWDDYDLYALRVKDVDWDGDDWVVYLRARGEDCDHHGDREWRFKVRIDGEDGDVESFKSSPDCSCD